MGKKPSPALAAIVIAPTRPVEKISPEQAAYALGVGLAPADEDRLWTAAVVAEDLGVPLANVLAAWRTLSAPDEVVLVRGEAVATKVGREKIRLVVDVAMRGEAALPPVRAAKPAGVETLRVTRLWGAKRVLARRANGLEVVCAVQASVNLMAGMELVDAQPGLDGMWFYYGRLPRRYGRW